LTFATDASALAKLSQGVPPLVDDLPTLEYAQVSHVMQTRLPAGLIEPRGIARLCPSCARDAALTDALRVAEHVYHSKAYAEFSNLVDPVPISTVRSELDARELAIVEHSSTLRWLLRYEPHVTAAGPVHAVAAPTASTAPRAMR
jgi:hypothetical protein